MCAVLQHEVQLEVELELTEALARSASWWSAYHDLPAAADCSTRWRVQFERHRDDEMLICLKGTSLDERQLDAAVRVLAVVNSDPSNSVDTTTLVPRGDKCERPFAKPLSEWGDTSPTRVLVRLRWMHVVSLCP